MEIKLIRREFSDYSTIGDFFVNDKQLCFSLEDKDRGLDWSMDLKTIEAKKVYGATCIPYGRYEVVLAYSPHFKKNMPLLRMIKGYDGVLIHPGNTEVDTLGCILIGRKKGVDKISESQIAFQEFFPLFEKAIATEKVFITIVKAKENIILR